MYWVLNVSRFSTFQYCQYARVVNFHSYTGLTYFLKIWQGSEYASRYNYGRIPNIPGFRMYQLSVYAKITQGHEHG